MKDHRRKSSGKLRIRNVLFICVGILVCCQAYLFLLSSNISHSNSKKVFRRGNPWENDILHLNAFNEQCLTKNDTIISWKPNRMFRVLRKDLPPEEILAELRQCHEVDIFLPFGIRSHGYCEDAMAYVKFLETRALPMWVFQMEFRSSNGTILSYFDLCPNSAVMFMNHYWDDLDQLETFPKQKKIVLMPNVEMYELKAEHYQRADFVLAKTKDGYRRIKEWYEIDGNNPRNTQVILTQHTSSDPTTTAAMKSREERNFGPIQPRNFDSLTVFHANGRSTQKNTPKILDCWHERPDLPMLHVYSHDKPSNKTYWNHFHDGKPLNLDYHNGEFIEPAIFGKMMAEASVILCPSMMEGFGHYINQARAAGALVVTVDAPPMNEFIDADSGVLILDPVARATVEAVLMGKNDTEYDIEPSAICKAMDHILDMTPQEREERAKAGQKRYFHQLGFFSKQMQIFRATLHSHINAN